MDSSVAVDLPDLTAQLDAWRQSHRKRARIPDHFYKTAVALLDRYSVSAICTQTRLRPASLRKHAPARVVPTSFNETSPPTTSFLQLDAADLVSRHSSAPASSSAPRSDSSSRLFFERADGSRLTLYLSSPDPQHLEALCLSLMRS
jgi:hypothetical protein